MTWVIGACAPFGGYAAALADVQVSLPKGGPKFDALLKVHHVGPFLALGFAGSVKIGFEMVDSLREFLAPSPEDEPNSAWIPSWVAENWCPMAVQIFARASAVEQENECHLLLIGVHPVEDVLPGLARAFVIRMSLPNFRPWYSRKKMFSVLSIGKKAPKYRRIVRDLFRPTSGIIKAEIGSTGGWGRALSFAIGGAIERDPVSGISPHLTYVQVSRRGTEFLTNDRIAYPRAGESGSPTEFRMPALATNYPDLVQLLALKGVKGIGATC